MKEAENIDAGVEASVGYRVFGIVRTIFVYLLALAIVVGALFFAADRSPNKAIFGYRYYTVLTDSMVPEFASGDMVIVRLADADSISVGDIITFNPSSSSDAYLTHRVTERIDDYEGTGVTCFRTKGDANDADDSFLIDETRLIGTVQFHVPKLGFVVRFIQLRWYFILPIAALIVIFFALMRSYFHAKEEDEETAEAEAAQTAASEKKDSANTPVQTEKTTAEESAAQEQAAAELEQENRKNSKNNEARENETKND